MTEPRHIPSDETTFTVEMEMEFFQWLTYIQDLIDTRNEAPLSHPRHIRATKNLANASPKLLKLLLDSLHAMRSAKAQCLRRLRNREQWRAERFAAEEAVQSDDRMTPIKKVEEEARGEARVCARLVREALPSPPVRFPQKEEDAT